MKLLLVDDHRLFLDGLRPLLAQERGFEVVGEAMDGEQAVAMVDALQPDVVLMDVAMPGLNGIEATRRILALRPATRVVILTMHADRRYVKEAIKAGASGYLLKDASSSEVIAALRQVGSGRVQLSPRVRDLVVDDYVQGARGDSQAGSPLTPREQEVLEAMAEGLSTKEIAWRLHVSTKTIETHRKQVMDKLDLHNLADLVKYAIREGLTPLS